MGGENGEEERWGQPGMGESLHLPKYIMGNNKNKETSKVNSCWGNE